MLLVVDARMACARHCVTINPYKENSCWLNRNRIAGCDWIDFAFTLRNIEGGTEFTYYECKAGASSITKYTKMEADAGPVPGPAGFRDGKLFGLYGETLHESGGTIAEPCNFRGTIAAVKLWNRALSADEIDRVFRDAASPLVLDGEDLILTEDRMVSSVMMTGDCMIGGTGKLIVNTPDGIAVCGGTATLSCPVLFDTGTTPTRVTVDATSRLVQTGEWSGASPIRLVGTGCGHEEHAFELRGVER